MGKLNIAHHKSYHPYRLDNIERVRRDEEEAELKEAREEGRMLLADSEARMQLLRERAGLGAKSGKEKKKEDEKREQEMLQRATSGSTVAESSAKGSHINFFEDLEQSSIAAAIQLARATTKGKGKDNTETEKGIPLAPSEKDLKPWYTDKEESHKRMDDEKRTRDLSRKSLHDPLTAIQQELAVKYPSSSSSRSASMSRPRSSEAKFIAPNLQSRLSRESSERQRAQELIRRKQRERERMAGSETPSTVHGGIQDEWEYGNQFNRRDVADAHRNRRGLRDDNADGRRERWRTG